MIGGWFEGRGLRGLDQSQLFAAKAQRPEDFNFMVCFLMHFNSFAIKKTKVFCVGFE